MNTMGKLFSTTSCPPNADAIDGECLEYYLHCRPWATTKGITNYKALSEDWKRSGCTRHRPEDIKAALERAGTSSRRDTHPTKDDDKPRPLDVDCVEFYWDIRAAFTTRDGVIDYQALGDIRREGCVHHNASDIWLGISIELTHKPHLGGMTK
jgi:hypothetical protein